MHVAFDARHVQSSLIQPGLQLHKPHSQMPFSGPPHSKPWSRSHEKLSHWQNLPEITSSGLLRLSHSHTPHTHCPLPLQSTSVVLSGRHPTLRSDSLCTSMLKKKFKNIKLQLIAATVKSQLTSSTRNCAQSAIRHIHKYRICTFRVLCILANWLGTLDSWVVRTDNCTAFPSRRLNSHWYQPDRFGMFVSNLSDSMDTMWQQFRPKNWQYCPPPSHRIYS